MISKLIVPVLNRYDLLQRMVSSIDEPIEELLIIDNGNELGTLDVPDLVKRVSVLSMSNNLGIAPSWNLGVRNFPFEDVYFFTSNDCIFQAGTLAKLKANSKRDAVTISELWPHWQLFSVGDQVFEECGLFDEAIFPMNFEDDEFEWRVTELGFAVQKLDLPMQHDGQMTFKSDAHYAARNAVTYKSNESYFNQKKSEGRLNAGEWSLKIRRANNW
jgi:GT2 family glycosyltransferase